MEAARRAGAGRGLVERAERFVRGELAGEPTGHDWWHADRVRRLALAIAREEGADELVVELAALLHDVGDYKLSGSEEAGPRAVRGWLIAEGAGPELTERVVAVVRGVSFKGAGVEDEPLELEGRCVRDADRLDALGAVGIARAFAYGGFRGQPLHDPEAAPRLHRTAAEYREATGTTINHFHEKLLRLRDRMGTAAGRRIAQGRHRVLEEFLDRFQAEWDARDASGRAR